MTRVFQIVLKIATDDDEEDLCQYPYEDALAGPGDEPPRYVKVVSAVEVKRD